MPPSTSLQPPSLHQPALQLRASGEVHVHHSATLTPLSLNSPAALFLSLLALWAPGTGAVGDPILPKQIFRWRLLFTLPGPSATSPTVPPRSGPLSFLLRVPLDAELTQLQTFTSYLSPPLVSSVAPPDART